MLDTCFATCSPLLISVKHSLPGAEQSPWHLDRQHLLFRNRLWAKMLLFLAHFIYLPDGRNLWKVSLFVSKAADAKEANLLLYPNPIYLSCSLSPTIYLAFVSIYPPPIHPPTRIDYINTDTLHLPPSDLLSLHLCSCLSPVGCSVALIWLFFSDVSASVCQSKTVFTTSKNRKTNSNGSSLCYCMNTVKKRKLHLAANWRYHLTSEEPLGVEDEVWWCHFRSLKCGSFIKCVLVPSSISPQSKNSNLAQIALFLLHQQKLVRNHFVD